MRKNKSSELVGMWIILTTYPVLDFDVTADAPVPVAAAAAAAAASCCFNFEAPDAAAQPLFFLQGDKNVGQTQIVLLSSKMTHLSSGTHL